MFHRQQEQRFLLGHHFQRNGIILKKSTINRIVEVAIQILDEGGTSGPRWGQDGHIQDRELHRVDSKQIRFGQREDVDGKVLHHQNLKNDLP